MEIEDIKLDNSYRHALDFHAALNREIRINIVNLLNCNGLMSVEEMRKHFNVAQPTMSEHLKILKHARIVKSKRDGRGCYYEVDKEGMKIAMNDCEKAMHLLGDK